MKVFKFFQKIEMLDVITGIMFTFPLVYIVSGFGIDTSTKEGLSKWIGLGVGIIFVSLLMLSVYIESQHKAKKSSSQETQFFINPITGDKVQVHRPGQVRVLTKDETYKSFQPSK